MAQTLSQITKQIEKLQKEADALRHAELKGVVDRIKVAISHYGLTPDQLGFGKPALKNAKGAKIAAKSANRTAAPRFANNEGQVWSGRGPRPRWLREALANGRLLEEFSADAHKRPSKVVPESPQRNAGAVVALPIKANVAAKRAKANANAKKAEIADHPVSPTRDDASAGANAANAAAPNGKRRVKMSPEKSPRAKKALAARATSVIAKSASLPKTKRASRVAAAANKATTGDHAEKSGAPVQAPTVV